MAFKIVINEPKTRKSYQIEKDAPSLIGLKIGDKFDGSIVGLSGFTLQVTGGSDKDGFPMRTDMEGSGRKKILLSDGPGYVPRKRGVRKRKYVRGNKISDNNAQVNVKIVEGEGDVAAILGIKKPEEKKEEAPAEKEEEAPPEEKKEEAPKKEEKPAARTPSAAPSQPAEEKKEEEKEK
ncbi:MAG: 30S ribosomal protein S6e [Candidatus Aenigmatarchaeota archaeon]